MYASSFIGTLAEVESALDRALAFETYSRPDRPLDVATEAIAAIADLGELATTALPNARIGAYERMNGDEAIKEILRKRVSEDCRSEPEHPRFDAAQEADRVCESGGTTLIPVGDGLPGTRNWGVLVPLLIDWLDDLIEGFRRVHRRASVDGDDQVETLYWIVTESLEALREALVYTRTIGMYTVRSVRQGRSELTNSLGEIATAVAGGDHA